ncbi:unnamed protein product [Pieris macdunnoughi]|uniref:PiggyBac transposable element-derived protein domain-containing protein n=1 Tax=Pieris macdunnoughi TaxID=345717 RepID=A0A821QHJ5_9NEOP|nr:unnamed protein product [Pieris macdunnoughi]
MPRLLESEITKYLKLLKIQKMLDGSTPNYDRLFKIRPLEEMLNCQFGKVPLDQRLSIDEQMCATKMSHNIKQYMPKLNPTRGGSNYISSAVYKDMLIDLRFTGGGGSKITSYLVSQIWESLELQSSG